MDRARNPLDKVAEGAKPALAGLDENLIRSQIEQHALRQLKVDLPSYRAHGFRVDHLVRMDGSIHFSGRVSLEGADGAKEVRSVHGVFTPEPTFNPHGHGLREFTVGPSPMKSDAMVWSSAAREKLAS
jgi:hypothetical protein